MMEGMEKLNQQDTQSKSSRTRLALVASINWVTCSLAVVCLGLSIWTTFIYTDLQETKHWLDSYGIGINHVTSSSTVQREDGGRSERKKRSSGRSDWQRFLPEITCGCKDGEPGVKGDRGFTGTAGPKGDRGVRGSPGRDGPRGPPGAPGIPGADGAPGLPGPIGEPGVDGRDGADGQDASAGRDGAVGADGSPGRSGEPGLPGLDAVNERKYINWGKHSCASDFTALYYTGFAAAVETTSVEQSVSNDLQCLPSDSNTNIVVTPAQTGSVRRGPVLSEIRLTLLGVKPPTNSSEWEGREGKRLPCAVCVHPSSVLALSFGTNNCSKNTWKPVYNGYAMAPHRDQKLSLSSEPICVNQEPDKNERINFPDDVNKPRSADYSFVRSTSTFNSPNRLVPCVVCAKS